MKKIVLSNDAKIYKLLDENNKLASNRAKLMAKVILLKSDGKSMKFIKEKTGLSKRTIEYCIASYLMGTYSFYQFIQKNDKTRKSELSKNNDILEYFKENNPTSYKEARETIITKFRIEKNISTVRRWLIKNGIKPSKKQ